MGDDAQAREPKDRKPSSFNLGILRLYILMVLWEQPIAIFILLFAFLILSLAPQSPDMFAAMDSWWSKIFFPVAVVFLVFSSWYWVQATLRIREVRRWREFDVQWKSESWTEKWSEKTKSEKSAFFEKVEQVENMSLGTLVVSTVFSLLILLCFLGLGNASQGNQIVPGLLSVVACIAFVILSTVIVYQQHRRYEQPEPELKGKRRWFFDFTAMLAAGPWVAGCLLLLSAAGVVVVAFVPELVDLVDAPIAVLVALALVIPPLVLALTLARDLVWLVREASIRAFLWCIEKLCRAALWVHPNRAGYFNFLIEQSRRFQAARQEWRWAQKRQEAHWVSSVGLVVLLVWLIFQSWFLFIESRLYEIRTTARLPEAEDSSGSMGGDTVKSVSPLRPRPKVDEALAEWRQARLDAGHPPGQPMPAIIVAAAGGGSRAAVWLLSSMEMLDQRTEGKFGRYLFAISGVSGGSLGAVSYLQLLREHPRTVGSIVVGLAWDKTQEKLTEFYQSDLLVASISAYFLNDFLRPVYSPIFWLIRSELPGAFPDRGTALELAFERHWANRLAIPENQAKGGFIELWQGGGGGMPHLLLNGTDVDSGGRLITSTIRFTSEDDLFAASDDLLTLLKHDVPASTAVSNSARFPFFSPEGRLRVVPPRRIVDGGYFENYGARTAAELADKIEQISREKVDERKWIAPIVPILVVVSNDTDALRPKYKDDDEEACKKKSKHDDAKLCKQQSKDDACLSLEEATVSCVSPPTPAPQTQEVCSEGAQRAGIACKPRGGGLGSEVLAPGVSDGQDARSEEVQQAAIAREPRGGGLGPEVLAPFVGLYATRGAHGKDALHIVRRHYCPVAAQTEDGPAAKASQPAARTDENPPRMIHIALPRWKPECGESAPLNWVLNKSALCFLCKATGFDFNVKQADRLRGTLQALLGGEPVGPDAETSLLPDYECRQFCPLSRSGRAGDLAASRL